MKVRMDDGTEIEGGPGDTAVIPPGHDAWVVGDEPCVSIRLLLEWETTQGNRINRVSPYRCTKPIIF